MKDLSLDYLFEVSWEVCNKVGGIHTVIATKAPTVSRQLGERYLLIGPDVNRESANPEFEEAPNLLKAWRQSVYEQGIRIRVGHWKIAGDPIAILVDFSNFFSQKDQVLKELWESYKVDSISGGWDYIEPVLFGYAAGKVIESYARTFCKSTDRMAAHFHEWMTASGGLYLRNSSPYIANVFTTHATVMGRCIAGNGLPLYGDLERFNADQLASQFGVSAKHSIERTAVNQFDCFATVSDLTARECRYLLGKEVDVVTPNGFEDDFVWKNGEFAAKRSEGRRALLAAAEACLGKDYDQDPLIVITSGRYEFKNKGIDVFIDSLIELSEREDLNREVLAVIAVPAGNNGPRKDLQAHLADPSVPIDPRQLRNTTHYLSDPESDPTVRRIRGTKLADPKSKVQVLFVPTYLNGADGIFNKHYYEILVGCDISVFPSYYEPWGYTPLESIAFSVPTVTTTLTGFGLWVDQYCDEEGHIGVEVINRNDTNDREVVDNLSKALYRYLVMSPAELGAVRVSALKISEIALWDNLIDYYAEAYDRALESVSYRTNRVTIDGGAKTEQINFVKQQLESNHPNWVR
ncbi:MAG: glycosyltransferase, partial [Rikenellaceae bacterium]|nr:glycosyltransferase [Rikenellaceae bacterium]